ncbi:MAG: DUF3048 C-terminal domain-containing protein, partial [Bacillota bacterium]|nr:DUF3048 C-terminal domain-containing protein [Bacillota bacterium]
KAGPVRSARPYLAVKAAEFDAYFAHVGGSMQALADIVNYGIADFDGLNSGAFRREPPKEPPHNTYLSIETMLSEAERLGYRPQSEPQFLRFGEAGDGDMADYLGIRYRAATDYDPTGYYVEFYYDAASNLYKRYMNGEEHRDAASNELLTCSNVIVQIAGHHQLDREGRLAIDVIGGGFGHFFRDGKVYPITWRKNALKDPTKYYDAEGQEVLLALGKTWIQVVPYDSYEYKAGNP